MFPEVIVEYGYINAVQIGYDNKFVIPTRVLFCVTIVRLFQNRIYRNRHIKKTAVQVFTKH